MAEQHAIISLDQKSGKVSLKPFKKEGCRVLVNGSQINGTTDLDHNDRLVFGSTQLWVFQNPRDPEFQKKSRLVVTYEYAQEELAAKSGINITDADNCDVAQMQDDLLEVMPAVEEANSISEELDKKIKFEIAIISPYKIAEAQTSREVL